jgi:hypothetical protein
MDILTIDERVFNEYYYSNIFTSLIKFYYYKLNKVIVFGFIEK